MKLLLILGSDDNYHAIADNIALLGMSVIRYRHVLKAMDNIDEIDPQAVIISARDFPLHWKILVQFIRSERPKERCPIILLKGDYFSAEESAKALFLGVNGIVPDAPEDDAVKKQLRDILESQGKTGKPRQYAVEPWHNINLLIADLFGASIITTDVITISSGGLSFSPVNTAAPIDKNILHKELHECSLRTGDAILSPVCRISSAGKTITADFISFPPGEQQILEQYLVTCNI